MAWGGARRGAGRPCKPIKRIGRTFRLSDEEFLSLRPLIMAIKANNDRRYETKRTSALICRNDYDGIVTAYDN